MGNQRTAKQSVLCLGLVAVAFMSFAGCATSDSHLAKGVKYYEQGQTSSAAVELQKAIQENPDNWEAYHYLAKAYGDEGLYTEAIDTYETGIARCTEKKSNAANAMEEAQFKARIRAFQRELDVLQSKDVNRPEAVRRETEVDNPIAAKIRGDGYVFEYNQAREIPLAESVVDMVLSSDGRWLHVCVKNGWIYKIGTNDGSVAAKTTAGAGPRGLLIDNRRRLLYCINGEAASISVVNLKNDANIGTIDINQKYFFSDEYYLVGDKIVTIDYNNKYAIDPTTRNVVKLEASCPWYEIRNTIAEDLEQGIGYGFALDRVIKIDLSGDIGNVLSTIDFGT